MVKTLNIPIDTTVNSPYECEDLVKRGDILTLQIKVFKNMVLADLTGQTVDLILKKSDNTLIEKTITSTSNGIITATLDVQATVAAGLVSGEVQLSDSNSQSSTNTFAFMVDNSLADDVIEVSKDDIDTLNDLRDLIAVGEAEITKYKDNIIAIANSIEAVEALKSIKSYIDANLADLKSNNSQAVTNNTNLVTQNNSATTNISSLTTKNSEADKLIKTLESDISTGNALHDTLQKDFTKGNYIISQLNTSDWFYVLSIAKLYEKTLKGSSLTDENSNIFTDENSNIFVF